MEQLINEILKRGGSETSAEIKLSGAGKNLRRRIGMSAPAIPSGSHLKRKATASPRGSWRDVFRKVHYFTDSGRVPMKKIMLTKPQRFTGKQPINIGSKKSRRHSKAISRSFCKHRHCGWQCLADMPRNRDGLKWLNSSNSRSDDSAPMIVLAQRTSILTLRCIGSAPDPCVAREKIKALNP